jgi:hypothetical protein
MGDTKPSTPRPNGTPLSIPFAVVNMSGRHSSLHNGLDVRLVPWEHSGACSAVNRLPSNPIMLPVSELLDFNSQQANHISLSFFRLGVD